MLPLDSVNFFYEHASYSYDPNTETPDEGRKRTARALAKAEVDGLNAGMLVTWYEDEEEPGHYLAVCRAKDVIGRYEQVASLGGVDADWDSPYRRVVTAELFAEALAEIAKIHSPAPAAPVNPERNSWLMWVCTNCILHHANGECGDCHREEGHDYEPLGELTEYDLTMGLLANEHDGDCIVYILDDLKTTHADLGLEWPDVPSDYECECHRKTHSTYQCEGCGSYLHGEREALTAWERDSQPTTPPADLLGVRAELEAAFEASEGEDINDAMTREVEAFEVAEREDERELTLEEIYLANGIDPCQHCGKPGGH